VKLCLVLALAAALLAQTGLTAGVGLAIAAAEPRLSLVGGPPRAFGGTTISRTFKVDGAGQCDLVWESRIFRGIVNRGSRKVDAPANVTIELQLPEVHARVDMIQQVQLKRDGKVLAEDDFVLGLFSGDALPELGRTTAEMPPIGLCDPEKLLAPILEKTGIKYILLKTDLQVQTLESKLVLVAPNQPETLSEPMGGIRELLERGGTVLFLEQSSPRKGFFDSDKPVAVVERAVSSARKLVGDKHILLRDLLEGDLADWAGSGEVASHALAWPECPGYQAWLAGGEGRDDLPLVAQYWGENGRVIVCQLEVGRRLAKEPVAQLILRNLLSYAREIPLPAQRKATRFAVPSEALADGKFNTARFVLEPKKEDLKGAAGLLVLLFPKGDESAVTAGFDLDSYMAEGGKLFVQSKFGPEFTEALNHLVRSAWPEKPYLPLPEFVAIPVKDKEDVQVRYAKPLAWGILAEDFQQSLGGVEDHRCLKAEPDVPEFLALTDPSFLTEFRRGKSRLVLCALPVEGPENESQARVVRQILANMSLEEDKDAQ
jgi:hypothetical protein